MNKWQILIVWKFEMYDQNHMYKLCIYFLETIYLTIYALVKYCFFKNLFVLCFFNNCIITKTIFVQTYLWHDLFHWHYFFHIYYICFANFLFNFNIPSFVEIDESSRSDISPSYSGWFPALLIKVFRNQYE